MRKNLPLADPESAESGSADTLVPFKAPAEPSGTVRRATPSLQSVPPRDEVLQYLLSFDLYEQIGNQEEGIGYATHHVDRFLKTLQYIPRIQGPVRMLELGASPYFMSFLIMKYLGYEITPANYFGDYGEKISGPHKMTVSSKRYGESYTFDSLFFNVETDAYPYPDGQFDIVLCCEILEHLARNPSHLMRESHRVLKPGGTLMLSTPNAVRLENLLRMVRGRNVYAPYSGYGVYGRHNREYSPGEVHELLAANNFEPSVIVDDAYPHDLPYRLANRILRGRRDNLFALGRKVGQTVECRPGWLFEHNLGLVRARTNYVIMGDEEHDQLRGSWSDFEYGPPGVRFAGTGAGALLLPSAQETRVGFHSEKLVRDVRGRVLVNDQPAGEFSLRANQPHDVIFPIPSKVVDQLRAGKIHYYDVTIQVDSPEGRVLPIEKLALLS